MGNQQAHRAVNEQVASAGRGLRVAGGRGARRSGSRAAPIRVAAKTDRLVAWRED